MSSLPLVDKAMARVRWPTQGEVEKQECANQPVALGSTVVTYTSNKKTFKTSNDVDLFGHVGDETYDPKLFVL